MKIVKWFRYRLRPKSKAQGLMSRFAKSCRFVFNRGLDRRKALLFCLLIPLCIQCTSLNPKKNIKALSVPKSGSHLLAKALQLICEDNKIAEFQHLARADEHHYHFKKRNPYLLLIRDPRDIFVSMVNWMDRCLGEIPSEQQFSHLYEGRPCQNIHHLVMIFPEWKELSFEDKLYALLTLDPNYCVSPTKLMEENFQVATKMLRWPYVQVLHFEYLVGEKGGGSAEKQQDELMKIAQTYHRPLSEAALRNVADALWGIDVPSRHNQTFHQGKIGKWKECYTAKHIAAFKKHWNQYLLAWKYETSEDW